jgi:predicted peptidase
LHAALPHFTAGTINCKQDGVEEVFQYQLFVPKDGTPDAGRKYPLIVWLHGHGELEFAEPNQGQLLYVAQCIFSQFKDSGECEFYLMAMQCPEKSRSWYGASENSQFVEPIEAVVQIVDRLIETEAIDPECISIVGISSGGSAAWELAIRYPEKFAAVAPTASPGGGGNQLHRIKSLPIWAFVNEHDTSPLRTGAHETIKSLQSIGGNAWLTDVPGHGLSYHDAWHEAFLDYGLLQWLGDQRQGQSAAESQWNHWRHQHLRWEVILPRLAPMSVALLSIIACLRYWRRRSPKSPPNAFFMEPD